MILQAMAPANIKTVSSNLLTPYREQPRSTRIVVATYPRPAFSATKRTNYAPISFDKNKSKFLKARGGGDTFTVPKQKYRITLHDAVCARSAHVSVCFCCYILSSQPEDAATKRSSVAEAIERLLRGPERRSGVDLSVVSVEGFASSDEEWQEVWFGRTVAVRVQDLEGGGGQGVTRGSAW